LKWAAPAASSGPAFSAYGTTTQNLTQFTFTKVTFGSEEFDTAGNFASSRFTPTTAGYYQLDTTVSFDSNTARAILLFYKNGSNYCRVEDITSSVAYGTINGAILMYLNGSSDYVEVYAQLHASSPNLPSGQTTSNFSGVWIRS
jgi:hypothetical protein